MHLVWRLSAGLGCAGCLVASAAGAQPTPPSAVAPEPPPASASFAPAPASAAVAPPAPPASAAPPAAETLETPYADVAPPAPPPRAQPKPPAASSKVPPALPRTDSRPLGPIRDRRKLALLGEIGWNGLAGFGPVLTYYPNPHLGLDLGAGASAFGWKAGARVRYNLLDRPWTPFLGIGFDTSTGLGQATFDPEKDADGKPNRDPVTINLKPSYLVQGVLGFDFIHKHGFAMVGCIGYSWLLNKNNLDILAGEFTPEEKRVINAFFKSGVVISLAMGYAFE